MLSPEQRPLVGAAMASADLDRHREWLADGNRDLELQDFIRGETLNGDWRPLAKSIRQQLQGWNGRLGIHGPFWGFAIDSPDPDIQAVVRKRMSQGLDVCEELGATMMVVHSPFTTWDYNNLDLYPDSREKLFANVHACLDGAVERAMQLGVTLVIENIEDKDPADRLRLVQSFGSENVRVSLDTGHAFYAHGSTGAPPVDYYVQAAGAMLAHVHLQDADGYADRHWALGDGTLPWAGVFRALAALETTPRLIIELRDKAGIIRSAAYLAGLGLAR